MTLANFLADDLRRNLMFTIIAVAITGASIVFFKDYGETSIWTSIFAACVGVNGLVIFLTFNSEIDEADSIKYLVAGQWLTLMMFCIMAVLVDQALIELQHRVDYNNCSMRLMILAIIMAASNGISLAIYVKPDLLDLEEAPARAPSVRSYGNFDDDVKALVNSICAANNEPPRYDIPKRSASRRKKKAESDYGKGGDGDERSGIHRTPRIRRPEREWRQIRRPEGEDGRQARRLPGGLHSPPGRKGLRQPRC